MTALVLVVFLLCWWIALTPCGVTLQAPLMAFRAGKLKSVTVPETGKLKMTADPRKGTIAVVMVDGKAHLQWRDRTAGDRAELVRQGTIQLVTSCHRLPCAMRS